MTPPHRVQCAALSFAAFLALGSARSARAEDVTLPNVVRLALARNERKSLAELAVVTADAAVSRARAGFLPSATLGATETLRPFSAEQNGRVTARTNATNATITVTQPLVSATTFPLYASAKHGLEAARFGALDQKRQLCFDAARSFFAVIAQERVRTAAKGRLERAEANLKDTRARAEAGIASTNDVTRSEIDRANALQSVSATEGAVRQARINVEFITDTALVGDFRPLEAGLAPDKLDLASLVQEAVQERPDLASARKSVLATASAADEPRLRFVPTLGASAQGRVADQAIAGDRYYDTTLTLNLSWALWDAGIRSADAQSRDAAAQTATLQARLLRRRVEADVRNAVAALEAARASVAAANQAVEGARRNVEETGVLYQQGLARAIELVDANLSRYDAEVSLAGAQLSLRQAELDLRAALGQFPVDGLP